MLVIAQLPQQIIHRTMIQIRISETEMLHATATRMIFNHNRTVAIVKFQQQIFAAQQKAGITLTDTVKNQSVLALTIMDRVMAITCTIAVFVLPQSPSIRSLPLPPSSTSLPNFAFK